MDRQIGILLMVTFGVSGILATALAWFFPTLNLDRFEASLAGVIGVGFAVFQSLRLRHLSHTAAEPVSQEINTEA